MTHATIIKPEWVAEAMEPTPDFDAKFPVGAPVIGSWDNHGTSMGRVIKRAWNPKKYMVAGFWTYTILKIDGVSYRETEDVLELCKMNQKYLRANVWVVS